VVDNTELVRQAHEKFAAEDGTGGATGKPIDVQAAHVWDVRDGRLALFQQYADTWRLAQVTGRTPAS